MSRDPKATFFYDIEVHGCQERARKHGGIVIYSVLQM
jgi:hypothetical protein